MTNWEIHISHDSEAGESVYFVTDKDLQLLIRPTPVKGVPVIVTIVRHKYHGKKSRLLIDEQEPLDPEALTRAQGELLIPQLLSGRTLFAEFYEWPFDQPQRFQVPLEGFAAVWSEACLGTPVVEYPEEGQAPWSQTADSLFLAFQAVAITAVQRLQHMSEAHHTVSSLSLAYLQHYEGGARSCDNIDCQETFQEFEKLSRDDVFVLQKEYKRMLLVASLTVLDTFLSDLIRFLFLYKQEAIPARGPQDVDQNEVIEKIVRKPFGGYVKRLQFIERTFGIDLSGAKGRLPELTNLTRVRNEIVHDLSMYEYRLDSKAGLWATPKPVVEVSIETMLQASMLIPEMIDAIFLEASRQFFEREPTIRPVTPELAAVHSSIRAERGWDKLAQSDLSET